MSVFFGQLSFADYAIDTTGVSAGIKNAVHILKTAGECLLIGIGGKIEFDLIGDFLPESKKISGVVDGEMRSHNCLFQN
ncbi:hypothetical protein PT285_00575 [Lactobacillus sp. ESL0791]|uniref:hypothetical protein n=1 Tax=Lactobacillus sp. ESL0791 TaxID=2983234 RepID=UPI0023F735FF|nr:hypothetical protein [Lactobacillus sp. ESL0791]MDF7637933.1 hypothetical protein [Lactobacillus sp. ESL0791]